MLLLNNKKPEGVKSSSTLSSASDSPVGDQIIWETNDTCQVPFRTYRGHNSGVTSCHFCMNDSFILSGSKKGTIQLWNASTGIISHAYCSHSLPITNCKISSDQTKVISSSWDKTLCYCDLETGNVLWRAKHDGIVMSCDLSTDGKYGVSSADYEDSIKLWDTRTGKLIQELPDFHRNTPTCCIFSPNSQRIASTSMDRVTKVWDLISKKTTITLTGHSNIVSSCCFSENERFLATTSWDKSIQVWDISTGMFRSQGSTTLDRGHEGSVSCCKFSRNGQFLLSGGYDAAVVIWDMSTKQKKMVLKGHEGWVNGVDISRDGRWVLSCSNDKTIRLWNIEGIDHLPSVLENRKAMGLRIAQCERCKKPFSLAQLEGQAILNLCVFCRLADPDRNTVPQL